MRGVGQNDLARGENDDDVNEMILIIIVTARAAPTPHQLKALDYQPISAMKYPRSPSARSVPATVRKQQGRHQENERENRAGRNFTHTALKRSGSTPSGVS